VALGKNPGGAYSYCQTNEKGEAEFKGLEPGNYTCILKAPCPFGQEWKDGKCVQVGDRTNNPVKQN
jgi:hypothetical protein